MSAKDGFKVKSWISNCLEMKDVNQSEQSLKVFDGASEEKVLKLFRTIQKILSYL